MPTIPTLQDVQLPGWRQHVGKAGRKQAAAEIAHVNAQLDAERWVQEAFDLGHGQDTLDAIHAEIEADLLDQNDLSLARSLTQRAEDEVEKLKPALAKAEARAGVYKARLATQEYPRKLKPREKASEIWKLKNELLKATERIAELMKAEV